MLDTVNDGINFGHFNMHCSSTLRRCHRANANPPRAWKTGRPVSKLLRVNYTKYHQTEFVQNQGNQVLFKEDTIELVINIECEQG